ncbi:hypothetical protein OIK40_11140 [Erythrobacter sp. sf7]|uniref:Uncharacterized protein n=1 Tax=Erythrobacter fulvus TaxID=2987523 RepID=A0ABT5JR96_9SPHN|nr:hypothetical protein [Erythrobacter fulvus]MDC8755193.1 hypothetical protein [Erythrobacter fulvus]
MAQQVIPASLKVVIEELSPDAIRCNVTKQGIEGATKSALRYNRITVSSEADAYVYVNANVVHVGGSTCVVALDVSVQQWDTLPDAAGGQIWGTFEYCNAGILQSGSDSANRLYAATKNAIDQCLADIKPSKNPSFNRVLRQVLNDKANATPSQ